MAGGKGKQPKKIQRSMEKRKKKERQRESVLIDQDKRDKLIRTFKKVRKSSGEKGARRWIQKTELPPDLYIDFQKILWDLK